MWEKIECCAEWDMAWFCYRCEEMFSWRTKGWHNTANKPQAFYCDKCKKEMEEKNHG